MKGALTASRAGGGWLRPGLLSGRGSEWLGAGHGCAEFGPRGDPQLAVDAGEVVLHRPRAELQGLGDLAVGVARRGQRRDALLGGGQREGCGRAEPDAGEL